MKTRLDLVRESFTVFHRGYFITLDVFEGFRYIELAYDGRVINAQTNRHVSDRTIADMVKMYDKTTYTLQECLDKVFQMRDAPSPDDLDDEKLLGIHTLLKMQKGVS